MASEKIRKYNALWPAEASDLAIEMTCIQKGGTWTIGDRVCGNGLQYHFSEMRKILWPYLDTHRWSDLCLKETLRSKVTVLMGAGSTGKTHFAAWFALCKYYCAPNTTCVLVSSTDLRGLELRVWGEIKSLHTFATERFDLPGNMIESKHAISTDDIDETLIRDLRKGIIGIPCVQNGKFVGLGKFMGIKQKNMLLVADEAQFMGASFLSAFSNLDKNENFKALVLGNPNDILDPLGKAAEPKDGWGSHMEPEKTVVWDTRFMNGRCVNLIGTDSPNFDYPENEKTKFPYLISREKIANTLSFFSKDSPEYYSQCIGAMKVGVMLKRVLSRDLCVQFEANSRELIWDGLPTKIGGLDAAYGGDRCITGHVEFGRTLGGGVKILIHDPVLVPIRVGTGREPEDQIAEFIKDYCQRHTISPENFFHDSTGRGSMGTALARVWSAFCNPVEFGGSPTSRPVSLDLTIYDQEKKVRRLKTCKEHYSKFVTELWFAVRYAVEAGQVRGLPEDVMEEFCMREWRKVSGDRTEVESKDEMKVRVGRSPDLADWCSICFEGARQRGFQISRLANVESQTQSRQFFRDLERAAVTHTASNLVYN